AATSNAHRVRVEVFSNSSAMFFPTSWGCSVPARFAALSSAARSMRYRHSCAVKSVTARKLRFRRSTVISDPLPLDRASHASRTATAPTELTSRDGDHLDAALPQEGVRGDVPVVGNDHSGPHGEHVAAVVPLLALGRVDVLGGCEH